MCSREPESPAVVGASSHVEDVRNAADQALQRYAGLGSEVAEWALDQAEKDARLSIRALSTFVAVHRLNAGDRLEELVPYFRGLWLSGRFVPLFKWGTASFLAAMSGVEIQGEVKFAELPPRPDWLSEDVSVLSALFPVRGLPLVRVLRTRLNEKSEGRASKRAIRLAWSFLGLKAMFPALWVDRVSDSLRDHAELLSSSAPPLSGALAEAVDLVADSVAFLVTQRYAKRTSGGGLFADYRSLPRPRLSSSAGWVKLYDQESRRWVTMRGTRAAQHERLSGLGGSRGELTSMLYHPSSGVTEIHQHPYQFDWREWDFDPRVSVVALQEPFKIRTISIADGPATAAASPLQAAWHGVLRSLFPFSLVGGARVADRVMESRDRLGNPRFSFDSGRPFVSGDYSAATDRLSMRATERALSRLLAQLVLPAGLRDRLEASLMRSVLDYSRTLEPFRGRVPDALLESVPLPKDVHQKNGQLMGNILSFPLLCIINLAGWVAMARESPDLRSFVDGAFARGYFTREELDDLPVLINGDDILFQCLPDDYERWLGLVRGLGLKPSVGKNYYSDRFFTINSELYTREGFSTRPWWGGFETDLVRMRNEVKFETGEDVLSADMRRVLPKIQCFLRDSVDAASWPVANRLFLEYHHSYGVLKPYSGLNWFLPVEFGGMGLDPTGWGSYRTTYAQKKLAIRMSLDPDYASRFFPGAEGSLTSAAAQRLLRESVPTLLMSGELVSIGAEKFVLDRHAPMAVRGPGLDPGMKVMVRLHPTVDTWVLSSRHLDRWLDYHTQGVRLDYDRVVRGVRRALTWGLAVSDKRLSEFSSLDTRPRYRCLRATTLVPVSEIIRLNAEVR